MQEKLPSFCEVPAATAIPAELGVHERVREGECGRVTRDWGVLTDEQLAAVQQSAHTPDKQTQTGLHRR